MVSAAMVGFAAGTAFALGLTLPPLLSKPEEVARVAAAMFTISYASTVAVSLICGALWDVTATTRAAFLPIIIASLMPIVLVPTIKFSSLKCARWVRGARCPVENPLTLR